MVAFKSRYVIYFVSLIGDLRVISSSNDNLQTVCSLKDRGVLMYEVTIIISAPPWSKCKSTCACNNDQIKVILPPFLVARALADISVAVFGGSLAI